MWKDERPLLLCYSLPSDNMGTTVAWYSCSKNYSALCQMFLLLYQRDKSICLSTFSLCTHTHTNEDQRGWKSCSTWALFTLACQRQAELTRARCLATAVGFNSEPTWLRHQANRAAGRAGQRVERRVEDLLEASWNHSHLVFFSHNALWRPDKHFRIHKDK